MWQKFLLQSKKNLRNKGFLTLEVIIATLAAFAFLMFSLQALTLSMMMKVKAQKNQRADQLIKEDIERVGNLGSILNTGDCDAAIYAAYDDGYAEALWDDLIAEAPDVTTYLLSAPGGNGEEGTKLSLYRTHISANETTGLYRNLKIFYEVKNDKKNEIVASRYIEIIPDRALECP